jgi:hypothetical protein
VGTDSENLDINQNICEPNELTQAERSSTNAINASRTQSESSCDVSTVLTCTSLSENEHVKLIESCFPDIEKNDISKKIHNFMLCRSSDCCSLKSTQKFDHAWLNSKELSFCKVTRLWHFVFVEEQGVYCLLCRKHNIKNPRNRSAVFADEPSKRFRKLALQEHLKTKCHEAAKYSESLSRVSVFQKEIDRKLEVKNEVLFQAFYSHLFVADQMIANFKINKLMKFMEHIGLKDLKYFSHRSAGSQREVLLTLSDTLRSDLIKKLQSSNCYGLMIDDLSDVSSLEQMIVYIQYFDHERGSVQTDFLFIANLLEKSHSANSETLFKVLCENFEAMNLDMMKITGLCTDGASVMIGKKDGLGAKLKNMNKCLIATHCVCHRLALACTDTNSNLKCVGNAETYMLQLWKLFHYSPKKMACFLKHLEGYRSLVLESSEKKKCVKILKRACKTRWLSFEASVTAAMEDLIPLVQTLSELSESDAAAYGLLKKMHSAHFVGLLFILHAILPILGKISRIFQKSYLNFSTVQPTLDSAVQELKQIRSEKSPIELAKSEFSEGGRLELLDITMNQNTEHQLGQTLSNYVSALVENIERRFPDVPILVALNIFNPCHIPDKDSESFSSYGEDAVEIIHQQFLSEGYTQSLAEVKAEWHLMKYHIAEKKRQIPVNASDDITPLEWCLSEIMKHKNEYNYMCPYLTKVVELVLTMPLSNAWPERGASRVKIIKTDLRNRLKNDMLNGLLQIAVNGPELCTEKCDGLVSDAVDRWITAKKRRKIPSSRTSGIFPQ